MFFNNNSIRILLITPFFQNNYNFFNVHNSIIHLSKYLPVKRVKLVK